MLRIVQLWHADEGRRAAVVEEPQLRVLRGCSSIYELATSAIKSRRRLRELIAELASAEELDYGEVYEGRSAWHLAPPIDHPQPSRCHVMGTGLTHKGSAENRQSMHQVAGSREQGAGSREQGAGSVDSVSSLHASGSPLPAQTDSMKMFQIGLEGGRPKPGCIGAAPEWFYKGTGTMLRAHNEPLNVPTHALDGGEEAEIAGIYLIGDDGTPYRIGLAQGNEFSDHVLESRNYLYLAESKLRDCALGPELVIEPKFDDVPGRTRIERHGKVVWEAPQASGERWMCHSLANLEHHHFKHAEHRRPGDVHIHFLGADMFSFKDRLHLDNGDVMTISFEGFGRPLRNPIRIDRSPVTPVVVKTL